MSGSYICIFGRTPRLSFLELSSFFPNAQPLGGSALLIEVSLDPKELIQNLGGTVKIAKALGTVASVTPRALVPLLELQKKSNHVVFGISRYDGSSAPVRKILTEIKSALEAKGLSARFVEARDEGALSSVVISKQDVVDLVILRHESKFLVGRTIAVQPFEEWNRRDYGRPFADPRSGMLPPKVARMLVNIAYGGATASQGTRLLLDPFCGMGTILAEALLTGWNVIGADQSAEVIDKTERNIRWLSGFYPTIDSSLELIVSDATHISDHVKPATIDAIVTEPFMGRTTSGEVKNIIRGLEKLYIGCLRDWYTILKNRGRVIMALPEYHVNRKTYFVGKVIDSCETLGYTTVTGPIEYSRPQAVVRRQFFVFQKR